MTIDNVAEKFGFPDLCPALTDFVCHYVPDNLVNYVIGGQQSGLANTDFNVSKIEVWSSVHVQTKSFHSTNKVMPSQHISACPPCHYWPPGCYNNVIVNTDNSKHWPWSGFDGAQKFSSLTQYNNINLFYIKEHCVAQLRLIMWVVPLKGFSQNPILDIFLTYVQHSDLIPQINQNFSSRTGPFPEPASMLFVLKQALQADGTPLGDIIPLIQVCALANLVPRFSTKADAQLMRQNSSAYSTEFWILA